MSHDDDGDWGDVDAFLGEGIVFRGEGRREGESGRRAERRVLHAVLEGRAEQIDTGAA